MTTFTSWKACLLAGYLLIVFLLLLGINLFLMDGIPHIPDDASYLFMAKMFAEGKVIMPIPISPEHFNFFPGMLDISHGTWLFQFPFGHPILLSIGVLLGWPNLVPPLIGTAVVLLLFLIARSTYEKNAAIFVLFLPLLSPFFLSNASSFMSHNTASFYLVLGLFLLIKALKSDSASLFLASGASLGLLFNTRPLTAAAFLLLFILIILRKNNNNRSFAFLAYFFMGIAPFFILWLGYNSLTTGNPLISQYYKMNQGHLGIEKTLDAYLTEHLSNTAVLFRNFWPMIFSWPVGISAIGVSLPFILRKNTFWDNAFLVSLSLLPLAYFFYNGTFLAYGPRFWYEISPFFFLLVARSFSLCLMHYKKRTIFVFVFLSIYALAHYFSLLPTRDPDSMSPTSLRSLKTFNSVDARILRLTQEKKIHHAVIFVADCGINWWCYGSVFPQNNPTLTTDIVYAKDLGFEKNAVIKMYFQGRSFYRVNYDTLVLEKL